MSKLTDFTVEVNERGERVYKRLESGGTVRLLPVWTMATCRERLAGADPAVAFQKMADWHQSYCTGGDPMFEEWSRECYRRVEHAYNELSPLDHTLFLLDKVINHKVVAYDDTIEEFGLEEIEEFGV